MNLKLGYHAEGRLTAVAPGHTGICGNAITARQEKGGTEAHGDKQNAQNHHFLSLNKLCTVRRRINTVPSRLLSFVVAGILYGNLHTKYPRVCNRMWASTSCCRPVYVALQTRKSTRGPPRRVSAYEISKSTGFHVDFRISDWISVFHVDFWISGFQSGFLDFKVDFRISKWISGFQSGFLHNFQSGFGFLGRAYGV